MASLKDLDNKIVSLRNTQKITRTMKLVAASKLRRAQLAHENAVDYARRLEGILGRLAALGEGSHPLLAAGDSAAPVLLVVFSSDRGLCGSFNASMYKQAATEAARLAAGADSVHMSFCGRRAHANLRGRFPVHRHYERVTAQPSQQDAARIARELTELFLGGRYREVYLVVNRFQSTLKQVPTTTRMLPVEPTAQPAGAELEYLFEPPQAELLDLLLPQAVTFQVFNALLENAAGEHAARMTAMENATRNADDLIDHYTLLRNRARQAAITTELVEIITGAESL